MQKYNIIWIVIDNKKICNIGSKLIKKDNIIFFETLDKTKKFLTNKNLKVNFFLFGSSIQYFENFEKILKKINLLKVEHIIVDRQPVLRSKPTKCAVQRTAPWAGNLSYAVKLYKSQDLINLFIKYNYFLMKCINGFGNQFLDGEYKTYIFKKK